VGIPTPVTEDGVLPNGVELVDEEFEDVPGNDTMLLIGVELGAWGVVYEVDGVVVFVCEETDENGVEGDKAEEIDGEYDDLEIETLRE